MWMMVVDVVCVLILLAWGLCVLVVIGFIVSALLEFARALGQAVHALAGRQRQRAAIGQADTRFLRRLGVHR